MNIRTSQNAPTIGISKVPKNQPVTDAPQVDKTQPQTDDAPKIETGPKLKPTVPSKTSPPIVNDEEVGQIQDQGAKVPSETLKQEASFVPKPEHLENAIKNLKHVEVNVDRTPSDLKIKEEIQQDSELHKNTSIPTKVVAPTHVEGNITPTIKGLSTQVSNLTSDLRDYERSGAPITALSDIIKDSLKRLDKTNSVPEFMGKQAKIDGVVRQTETDVQQMISSLSSKIDFSFHLQHLDDKQLEMLVTEAIGHRKGYDSGEMLSMSQKKNDFRDAVIRGIKAGLPQQVDTGNDLQGQQVGPQNHGNLSQKFDAIGQAAKQSVQALGHDSHQVWGLTMMTDEQLKSSLVQQLGSQKPYILDAVFKGLHEGLPNQASANKVIVGPGLEVHAEITVNGKTYDSPKYLNKGGYGAVTLYTNPLDPHDTIVVKQPIADNKTPIELFNEAKDEIRAHRDIQGNGHQNILGLQGVIRGENNQLLIVLDTAPNGDLQGLTGKMSEAVRNKTIQPETRDLIGTFMLRSVLEGGVHMQETQQGHHLDFKSPNIMIGGDGQPKIGDFGTSGQGLTKVVGKSDGVDNPFWKSPERESLSFTKIEQEVKELVHAKIVEKHDPLIQQLMGKTYTDNGKTLGPDQHVEAVEKYAGDELLKRFRSEGDAFIAKIPKHVSEKLRTEAVRAIPHEDGKSRDEVESARRTYVRNAVNLMAIEELKPQHPEDYEKFKNIALVNQAGRILQKLPKDQKAQFEALRQDVEDLKKNKGDIYQQGEDLRQQIGFTQNVAKSDTWGIGIVATELLLGGDVGSAFQHRELKGKLDQIDTKLQDVNARLQQLDAIVPKNEQEHEDKVKARLDIIHERDALVRERVSLEPDHKDHFDRIGLSISRLIDQSEAIKEFARKDLRAVGGEVELNLRNVALRYQGDPRFSGNEYTQMFNTLISEAPPMPPKPGASDQAQLEYRVSVSRYKTDNQLDDAGMLKVQEGYAKAITQFNSVIESETRQGAGARDKLINGLLHPDPEKRITLSTALENSIFKNDRIDKPEIKLLVKLLQSDNPDQAVIKELESSLLKDQAPRPEMTLLMHAIELVPPKPALVKELEDHLFKGKPLSDPHVIGTIADFKKELAEPKPDPDKLMQIMGQL